MRKGIVLVLVISMLCMSLTSVDAANSQGFEWGLEVGDQIYYTTTYYQPSVTSDPGGTVDFYAEIVSLPTIPDPVSVFSQIVLSTSNVEFYFMNGTPTYPMLYLLAGVAIGNWTLASEFYEAYGPANTSQSARDWIIRGSDPYETTEIRISKTDGAVNYWSSVMVDVHDEVIYRLTVVRQGYSPGGGFFGLDPTLLLLLGGGGAVVVIALVIWQKRR